MISSACRQESTNRQDPEPSETSEQTLSEQFIFVKIPESIMPIERGDKYEDPLDEALKQASIGEVTGGGSSFSHPDENGKRTIEWVGIDVNLLDFDKGLPILRSELLKLGAPKTTILEYTRNGQDREEPLGQEK